jgi:hypothetical protein
MTKAQSESKPFTCFISSANEDAKLANTIAEPRRGVGGILVLLVFRDSRFSRQPSRAPNHHRRPRMGFHHFLPAFRLSNDGYPRWRNAISMPRFSILND